ncbi:monovalent cation/H(+) antiporter subunit G [Candidatus Palauibacter polyketidifaciens]|uniref:monovalent cation/H(+) antiporter subunit G n=1 Tax=Candidatus Palauibacter polyketidifaciens TaxID=3056740 RepID=UPI00238B18D5|nr:monovalent cation/H(+) antiporter subunit G [Candidatus Palauibacter polyketidifaciens]MDE2719672.1 monovalent cation/H(+) antiporter subunit G [Candidatus Palauibacter polyketidifaciens]
MILEIVSSVLVIAGAVFAVIGGIGIVRLPDFFSRIHGAGITDTLGAGLILTGLMFLSPDWTVTMKLVAILVLLGITSPTATHALANAALETGLRPDVDETEEATSSS